MTASFMRFCKNASIVFCLLLVCVQCFAATNGIVVKSADLKPSGDVYKLNIYSEISLDSKIEEAINKGVPLTFIYEFQLVHPRKYWLDEVVASTSTHVTLSYHALSRQYLVSQDGHQTSYEILSEALIDLIQFEDWKVLDRSKIEKGLEYKAAVLVRLDKSKLPKALQVDAIGAKEWDLISEKYEWLPKDLNTHDSE